MGKKNKKKNEHKAEHKADAPVESGVVAKAESMMDSIKQAGATVSDAVKNPAPLVEAVRDKIISAAEAVDRTLETLKQALGSVDAKVVRAQEWTAEKVDKLESTLDTMRETVASAESLVASTQQQARRLTDIAADKLQKPLDNEAEIGEAITADSTADSDIARGAELDEEFEESTQGRRLDNESGNRGKGQLAPETGTPIDIVDAPELGLDFDTRTGKLGGGRNDDDLM